MVRQLKLTETFPEAKASKKAQKLPVKRKLVSAVGVDENRDGFMPSVQTVGLQVGLEDSFMLAKKALHTSRPVSLPGRESQIDEIYGWLRLHLEKKEPGAMYVSGAPGVGKTAVIQHSIFKCENSHVEEAAAETSKKRSFYKLAINCMCFSPAAIYEEIGKVFKITSKVKGDSMKERLHHKLMNSTKAANML
jgi:hypothetical protein